MSGQDPAEMYQERGRTFTTLVVVAAYGATCVGAVTLLAAAGASESTTNTVAAVIWLPIGAAAVWAKATLDGWLGLHRF